MRSVTALTATPLSVSGPLKRNPSFLCMEWNPENQLIRVTKNTIEQARFKYDPLGRRVNRPGFPAGLIR